MSGGVCDCGGARTGTNLGMHAPRPASPVQPLTSLTPPPHRPQAPASFARCARAWACRCPSPSRTTSRWATGTLRRNWRRPARPATTTSGEWALALRPLILPHPHPPICLRAPHALSHKRPLLPCSLAPSMRSSLPSCPAPPAASSAEGRALAGSCLPCPCPTNCTRPPPRTRHPTHAAASATAHWPAAPQHTRAPPSPVPVQRIISTHAPPEQTTPPTQPHLLRRAGRRRPDRQVPVP